MTCIANLDKFPKDVSADEWCKWDDKWNLRRWTASSMIQYADDDIGSTSKYTSLFVALEKDNLDWWKNNQECKYVKYIKEQKKKECKLPVITSEKKVSAFISASEQFLYKGSI